MRKVKNLHRLDIEWMTSPIQVSPANSNSCVTADLRRSPLLRLAPTERSELVRAPAAPCSGAERGTPADNQADANSHQAASSGCTAQKSSHANHTFVNSPAASLTAF